MASWEVRVTWIIIITTNNSEHLTFARHCTRHFTQLSLTVRHNLTRTIITM